MVRTFDATPVARESLNRILAAGARAPSAGFAQGFSFLVFHGADETARFWDVATRDADHGFGAGLRAADVIVVPLASKAAYLERYAEPDKGWTDRDEGRWSAPYWTVDTAFASMLILLAAVDEDLGALFFGLFPPERVPTMMGEFGVSPDHVPIGAIAIGHPAPSDPVPSSARTRARKPLKEIVHRARW